jgi:hypothetical protein
MNVPRLVPFMVLLACSGCAANAGSDDTDDRLGVAAAAQNGYYEAPGAGQWIDQGSEDSSDFVQVDGVLNHCFTVYINVTFAANDTPYPGGWNDCLSSSADIVLSKYQDGTWYYWVDVGTVSPVPVQSETDTVLCQLSWSNPSTCFGASTEFDVYVSQYNGGGNDSYYNQYIQIYQGS